MIEIYKTEDGILRERDEISEGCWIAMTNPLASELLDISERTNIDINHLRSPLDEEERARIEVEITIQLYWWIFQPGKGMEGTIYNYSSWYNCIKGLSYNGLSDTPILKYFKDGRVRDFILSKNKVHPADIIQKRNDLSSKPSYD